MTCDARRWSESWTAPRSWTGWSRRAVTDRSGAGYPLNGRDIDRRARREQRRSRAVRPGVGHGAPASDQARTRSIDRRWIPWRRDRHRRRRRRSRQPRLGRHRPGAPRLHRDPERVAVVRSRVGVERPHAARRRPDRRVVPEPADPGPHGRGAPAPGPHAADRRRGARRPVGVRPTTPCCCTDTSTSNPRWTGWRDGLGPWTPVLEGDRLYGRGGADDGYAAFASLTAIEAVHAAGGATTRCIVLIEASEESGSPDLPAYVEALADRIGHTEPGGVPRLRLHRLRPDVGHDLAARPRGRSAVGRHRHRGSPLGRRVGHDPVELPHQPLAALPDRGRGDRPRPAARVDGRDPRRPRARGAGDGRGDRSRSPTTTRSSTMPARPPTTRSSSSCRARGDRR